MRNDLRIVKTKKHLRYALIDLLHQRPLQSITVSELTRVAEVNRGTFYQHYRNVDQLFEEYFEEILLELEEAYMQPLKETENHPESINPSMIRFFHHVQAHQKFYAIVFERKASLNYYYKILGTIKIIMRISLFKDSSDFLLSYYANAILGIVLTWNEEGYLTTPEQLNEELIKYIDYSREFSKRNS